MENKTILIVEDDNFIAELYKRVLFEAGYKVDLVRDGEQGLSVALQGKYDLILLDLMLPKKDGIDVLTQLKADSNFKSPIMVLSNLGQENIIKKCLEMGAVGYMLKSQHVPPEVVSRVNDFFLTKSQ